MLPESTLRAVCATTRVWGGALAWGPVGASWHVHHEWGPGRWLRAWGCMRWGVSPHRALGSVCTWGCSGTGKQQRDTAAACRVWCPGGGHVPAVGICRWLLMWHLPAAASSPGCLEPTLDPPSPEVSSVSLLGQAGARGLGLWLCGWELGEPGTPSCSFSPGTRTSLFLWARAWERQAPPGAQRAYCPPAVLTRVLPCICGGAGQGGMAWGRMGRQSVERAVQSCCFGGSTPCSWGPREMQDVLQRWNCAARPLPAVSGSGLWPCWAPMHGPGVAAPQGLLPRGGTWALFLHHR